MNFPGSWRNIEIWDIWALDAGFEEFPKAILPEIIESLHSTLYNTVQMGHLMEWHPPGIEAVEGLNKLLYKNVNL